MIVQYRYTGEFTNCYVQSHKLVEECNEIYFKYFTVYYKKIACFHSCYFINAYKLNDENVLIIFDGLNGGKLVCICNDDGKKQFIPFNSGDLKIFIYNNVVSMENGLRKCSYEF